MSVLDEREGPRTTSGGGPMGRRLDGGVGEATLPPLEREEEQALRTAPWGEAGERSDDERV